MTSRFALGLALLAGCSSPAVPDGAPHVRHTTQGDVEWDTQLCSYVWVREPDKGTIALVRVDDEELRHIAACRKPLDTSGWATHTSESIPSAKRPSEAR